MADINFEIRSYNIWFYAHEKPHASARVVLTNSTGPNVILHFMDSELEILPAKEGTSLRPDYLVYYHKDRLPEILDVLRNEGPLSCATFTRNSAESYVLIYSGTEPVGEGEF